MSDLRDLDPTERFSDRAAAYDRYRPPYPGEVLDFLRDGLGLESRHVVVDVGSGTGLLSRLFLGNGNVVYGVEPNAAMRGAAEAAFREEERFLSVEGRAEATGLAAATADFVVAGQAFHWFEPGPAREEFLRILRPGGWVVLAWNSRRTDTTAFLGAYEEFLQRWCPEYSAISSHYAEERSLATLFGPAGCGRRSFENGQVFDYAGLEGRLLSSSYAPGPEHPRHQPMLEALHALFDAHQQAGRVSFEYDTEVYYGRPRA
jgi:SAM-dependent methyltransferase